jgi:hypothetical protein
MFQIGDFAKAREASNRALVKLTQIYEVAERRKDFNLLKDEPEVNPRLDLVELQKPVTPLSIELVSGLKSQQALATVKLACNAEQVDKVLLDEAAIMALSVIDGRAVSGKAPESPPNPKDPLANYVLGAVAESKGLELVKGQAYSSTAHQEAAKLFTEAKQRFSEAASGIKQAGQDGSGVNKLAQEINGRREKLESPNLAIAEANAKTVAGDLGEAVFVLREASLRHHSPAVWTALLQACRRGNQSIIEGVELGLGELSENRLLDETSENSILAVLQYWNRQALNQIGQQGSEKVSQEFKAAYKSAILSAERQLQSLGPTERLETPVFRFAALSLANVYSQLLEPKQETESLNSLKEAHRLAREAMLVLQERLEEEPVGIKQVEILESLADAQTAYGNLSLLTLPDYRDDSILALAAANDTRAKLPFSSVDTAMEGSPVISTLRSRGEDADTKLLEEERKLRSMAMEIADAAIGLKFGVAEASADTIRSALAVETESRSRGQQAPAAELLQSSDGFEDRFSFRDTAKAYGILASVAAGKNQEALRDSLQLLLPDLDPESTQSLDAQLLPKMIEGIQSPLTGCAVGLALEKSLDDLDISDVKQTSLRAQLAKQVMARAAEIFQESKRFQIEYPEIGKMIDQSVNRIGNVDYFLERVKQTRAKGDLAASKVELEAGLRLHSDNRELWTNYWNTELELVRRTGAGDIAQIKSRLKSGAEAGIVSEFERHFFNGILLQLEGDLESALNSFDEAVDVANTANQRIQAVAKGAEIRTKLVSLGN